MIIEQITVSTANLNAGTDQAEEVNIPVFPSTDTNLPVSIKYRVVGIRIDNGSGDQVNIIPMTAKEYLLYADDSTISDYIPIADGATEVIDNLRGYIQTIVVKGTTGSGHTDNLTITVYKEADFPFYPNS